MKSQEVLADNASTFPPHAVNPPRFKNLGYPLKNENITPLPLGKPYEIADAAVISFFAVLGEEATRYFARFAMIAHAFAAQSALGTTICAGAVFEVLIFQAIHV